MKTNLSDWTRQSKHFFHFFRVVCMCAYAAGKWHIRVLSVSFGWPSILKGNVGASTKWRGCSLLSSDVSFSFLFLPSLITAITNFSCEKSRATLGVVMRPCRGVRQRPAGDLAWFITCNFLRAVVRRLFIFKNIFQEFFSDKILVLRNSRRQQNDPHTFIFFAGKSPKSWWTCSIKIGLPCATRGRKSSWNPTFSATWRTFLSSLTASAVRLLWPPSPPFR